MSIHVISWVLRNSKATLGRRLVLLVLADHASEDGTQSYASVATIGREALMTRKAVQSALRRLEADGMVAEVGEGPNGTHNYTVLMGGVVSTPGVERGDLGGVATTPKPSLEQPSKSEGPSERRWLVDRKPVTEAEALLAQQVLAAWNRATRQSLRAKGHLAKIVMRIREYPELGLDEHEHIIRVSVDHAWWKGVPSPNVIYGNDAQFERQLTEASRSAESSSQSAFDVALRVLNERRAS